MARSRRDSRVEKWQGWLDESIRPEVIRMFHRRHVYRTVAEVIERHGELPPSAYFEFVRDTYGETQSLAVRRQADTRPDVISLARLLQEIGEDADRLTREWYLSLWDADDQQYAAALWERSWFAGVAGHVDPEAIIAHLTHLRDESEHVRVYVNRSGTLDQG